MKLIIPSGVKAINIIKPNIYYWKQGMSSQVLPELKNSPPWSPAMSLAVSASSCNNGSVHCLLPQLEAA